MKVLLAELLPTIKKNFARKKNSLVGGFMTKAKFTPVEDKTGLVSRPEGKKGGGAKAGGFVECGSFLPLGGGKYQFGLTFTRYVKAFRYFA